VKKSGARKDHGRDKAEIDRVAAATSSRIFLRRPGGGLMHISPAPGIVSTSRIPPVGGQGISPTSLVTAKDNSASSNSSPHARSKTRGRGDLGFHENYLQRKDPALKTVMTENPYKIHHMYPGQSDR